MRSVISYLLACAFLPVLVQGWQESPHEPGLWSTEATGLFYEIGTIDKPGTRRLVIASPNNKFRVIVRDAGFYIEGNGNRLSGPEDEGIYPLAEMAWCPDSRAFFLTQSDGGNVGGWFLNVYLMSDKYVKLIDITQQVKKDFMTRYKCVVPEDPTANEEPNIAAIKWFNDSKELLLLAEVPPHSSCPEMGKLMGYVVSVPSGNILSRYEEQHLRARWGRFLGERHRVR